MLMIVYQRNFQFPNGLFMTTSTRKSTACRYKRGFPQNVLVIALVFMLVPLGCKSDADSPGKFSAIKNTDVGTDLIGHSFDHLIVARSKSLPTTPQRIVSMAPNITEILFAIGAGDRVVGVTRYCDFPPRADELPDVGGIVDPDVEKIASLNPDILIGLTSSGNSDITRTLDKLEIPYVFLRMENLDETIDGIAAIGDLVGSRVPARELSKEMRTDVEAFQKVKPPAKKPSVLLVFGRKPLVVAGRNTFAGDLIERAHGVNAVTGDNPYPKLDIEKVLELDPDRIIDISMNPNEDAGIEFWTKYESLDAVQHGNVYRFTDEALMRPGPRLIDGFRRVAMAIKGKHGSH